ncbi:unnamed protein product [Gordionus sp. m RMFG-2023]
MNSVIIFFAILICPPKCLEAYPDNCYGKNPLAMFTSCPKFVKCPPGYSLTRDRISCCATCAELTTGLCTTFNSSQRIPQNDNFIDSIVDSKDFGEAICNSEAICLVEPGYNGLCLEQESLNNLLCPVEYNYRNYSGCKIIGGLCLCQSIRICDKYDVLFPFRDLEECQDSLNSFNSDFNHIERYKRAINEDAITNHKCPSDSYPVFLNSSRDNGIRNFPVHCECNVSACLTPQKACPQNLEQILKEGLSSSLIGYKTVQLRPGYTEHPGKCCPVFECLPIYELFKEESNFTKDEKDVCYETICPNEERNFSCSGDSIALPNIFEPKYCCSVPQGCQCLKELCEPTGSTICRNGEWPELIKLSNGIPGTCCDFYECRKITTILPAQDIKIEEKDTKTSCKFNQKVYYDGQEWFSGGENCVKCYCKAGLTFCRVLKCRKRKGDCIDVEDHNEIRGGGNLTSCCSHCNKESQNITPSVSLEYIKFTKNNGIMYDNICTLENGLTYRIKETWKENDCEICVCMEGGKVECTSQMCSHPKHCSANDIVSVAGICCPLCLNDTFNMFNVTMSKVAPVPGLLTNEELEILLYPHNNSVNDSSKISPPNFHCFSSTLNLYFASEETWKEDCRICYCMDGVTMCTLISCSIPKCEKPYFDKGDCCPRCKDSDKPIPYSNYTICDGEEKYIDKAFIPPDRIRTENNWTLPKTFPYERELISNSYDSWWVDKCILCTCSQRYRLVFCSVDNCPPAPCNFPQKNDKKEIPFSPSKKIDTSRKNSCKSRNVTYGHESVWKQDACTGCKCSFGKIKCYSQICAKQYCPTPYLQKGKCCPVCLGNVGTISNVYHNPTDPYRVNRYNKTPLNLNFFSRTANKLFESLFLRNKDAPTIRLYFLLAFLLTLILCVILFALVIYLSFYIIHVLGGKKKHSNTLQPYFIANVYEEEDEYLKKKSPSDGHNRQSLLNNLFWPSHFFKNSFCFKKPPEYRDGELNKSCSILKENLNRELIATIKSNNKANNHISLPMANECESKPFLDEKSVTLPEPESPIDKLQLMNEDMDANELRDDHEEIGNKKNDDSTLSDNIMQFNKSYYYLTTLPKSSEEYPFEKMI